MPIMPISASCPTCGKRHKAPDRLAGREVACLSCGQPFTIPQSDVEDAAAALLEAGELAETAPPDAEPEPTYQPASSTPQRPAPKRRVPDVTTLPPLTTNDPPLWRRHLHWLLALALIPMIVSLSMTQSEDDSVIARIERTLEKANRPSGNGLWARFATTRRWTT
jgi:hypothetical protein